jgi:hypothetical protein
MDPLIRVDKSKKIPVYTVKKILSDAETDALKGKFLEEKHFPVVLTSDADVYNEEGELLLRFRKDVLPKGHIDDAWEALKDFIKSTSTDRGVASGSDPGVDTGSKKPVMSNIIGFFDKWSISQRSTFKRSGIKPPSKCRFCAFNVLFPEKWKRVVPLIQDISTQYERLCPKEYADQRAAARSTAFHIKDTAFSTVTTNLNFRTAAHKDSGDWTTGYGNLVVIERGSPYKGNYTGFPQYGVAVDCRNGDFLAMDVHQLHGNTPMIPSDVTSQRLSLVSYLREGIVRRCSGEKLYDAQGLEKRLGAWRAKHNKTYKKKRD